MPNPNPPPDWEERYRAILTAHEGSWEWFLDTLRNWLDDPWAKTRSTPGDLRVFIGFEKDRTTEIWRKHHRGRPPATCQAPAGCGHPSSKELGGYRLCETHFYRAYDFRPFTQAPVSAEEVRSALSEDTGRAEPVRAEAA
jgi:hypothetical protein